MAASSRWASACCSRHWAESRVILSSKGFAVVGLRLRADVAAGGEYVAVFANFFQRCALSEAGNVGVAITPVPSTGQDLALSHQGLYRYEPHTLTLPLCIPAFAGITMAL